MSRKTRRNTDLMLAAGEGDPSSFDQLVERNQALVVNIIYKFLGSRAEAEDLAQEVFLKVWSSRARYRPTARFTTWLYRITANLCINYRRERRRRRTLPLAPGGDEGASRHDVEDDRIAPPDHALEEDEVVRAVLEGIGSLPENQRIALILSKYEELSYKDIAEALEVSEQAVKSLLHRARLNLKEKFQFLLKDHDL